MAELVNTAMLAIEDLLIRYHRARGYRTLWLPGTDHAAIQDGFASVTPLHLDLTDYRGLEAYADLARRLDARTARWNGE